MTEDQVMIAINARGNVELGVAGVFSIEAHLEPARLLEIADRFRKLATILVESQAAGDTEDALTARMIAAFKDSGVHGHA